MYKWRIESKDKSINLQVNSTSKCSLYFDKIFPRLVDTLLEKANPISITDYNDTSGNKSEMYAFSHDATEQTGPLTDYRFIGSNPDNWIKFNGEDWRIIGVFTVDGEQRVKIMREETIGNLQWNSNEYNDWSNSSLNKILNGDYYNKIGDYIAIGLSEISRKQIATSTWYLGYSYGNVTINMSAEKYYNYERGTETCVTKNTCVGQNRITKLETNIGMIYPSDIVYTYANGVDENCFINSWNCNDTSGRYKSWIYNDIAKSQGLWSITSFADDFFGTTHGVVATFSERYTVVANIAVSDVYITDIFGTSPALYLNSNIKEIVGDGSKDNPYIIK